MAHHPVPPHALSPVDANDLARVDLHGPHTRRRATRNLYSPVMLLMALAALIGILA